MNSDGTKDNDDVQEQRSARNAELIELARENDEAKQDDEQARRQAAREDTDFQREVAREQYAEKWPNGDPQ